MVTWTEQLSLDELFYSGDGQVCFLPCFCTNPDSLIQVRSGDSLCMSKGKEQADGEEAGLTSNVCCRRKTRSERFLMGVLSRGAGYGSLSPDKCVPDADTGNTCKNTRSSARKHR